MTWNELCDRYGTDKPDLRFGLELIDLSQAFENTEVKAFSSPTVKAIVVPDGATWRLHAQPSRFPNHFTRSAPSRSPDA